jgi:hypothetical protein
VGEYASSIAAVTDTRYVPALVRPEISHCELSGTALGDASHVETVPSAASAETMTTSGVSPSGGVSTTAVTESPVNVMSVMLGVAGVPRGSAPKGTALRMRKRGNDVTFV